MEETSVMMVGLDSQIILQGLQILDSQPRGDKRLLRQVSDYSMPNVSDKVVRIIYFKLSNNSLIILEIL